MALKRGRDYVGVLMWWTRRVEWVGGVENGARGGPGLRKRERSGDKGGGGY